MDSLAQHEKQITILAIDDTPDNLSLLLNHLASLNYKVLVAESGVGALEQIENVRPDLILLDVLMPIMDGYETCLALKNHPNSDDVPIIFLSAQSDPVDKVRGFQAGGSDFITKPIDIAEVSARINTHLQIKKLTHRLTHQNQLLKDTIADRNAALALQKNLGVQREASHAQLVKMTEAQGAQWYDTLQTVIQSRFNNTSVWNVLHQPIKARLAKLQAQLAACRDMLESDNDLLRPQLVERLDALSEIALLLEGELATLAPKLQAFEVEQQLLSALSDRESDVLVHIADGYSSEEIALQLSLSPATVRTYRIRIMHKLNIHNVPGLVKFAIRQGISALD